MNRNPLATRRALVCGCLLAGLAAGADAAADAPRDAWSPSGPVVLAPRSDFSHILVRRQGGVLTLIFVRDNGLEVVESRSDPRRPQDLLLPYTQTMMLGCVVRPEHDRALMLGLGGGSMAAFLAHHFPNLKLDVVEIDPAVVKIADELFGVRSAGNVRILTDDAFAFIRQTQQRYDAIYLDAFLKPSADTDETGKPLRLKTLEFYKQVRARLVDGGVVVFNVNDHDRLDDDLRAIRESFPQVYVFHAPPGNTIAIGSTDPRRLDDPTLRARARGLDAKLRTNFSFENLLERRRPSQR